MKNRRSLIAVGLAGLGIAGCAPGERVGAGAVSEVGSRVRDASGRQVASVSIQDRRGLLVRVEAAGMTPGIHGVHIHAIGRCEPPAFASAGPHWNPTTRQHGTLNPRGHHLGDIPNLSVGADGRGIVEFRIAAGALRIGDGALLDRDGAALVIHAAADDYRTDPSGNSGARIACGVLG